MAFEVGKRVVAERVSGSQAPFWVSLRRCSEATLASRLDPLGRRPREHLDAREQRPSSWARPYAPEAKDTTQALTDLRGSRAAARSTELARLSPRGSKSQAPGMMLSDLVALPATRRMIGVENLT
jgi:hypothetical protein